MSDQAGFDTLGSVIRQARKNRGLSIRGAAKVAGLSEGRWRQLEAGEESRGGVVLPTRPRVTTILRIADALETNRQELCLLAGLSEHAAELASARLNPAKSSGGVDVMGERVSRGWTADEAAKRAGVAPKTWQRIEAGLPVRALTLGRVEALFRDNPLARNDLLAGSPFDEAMSALPQLSLEELRQVRAALDTAIAIRSRES